MRIYSRMYRQFLWQLVFFLLAGCFSELKAQLNRPLDVRDSIIVKDIFFTGIKEKTLENYPAAQAAFSKVLSLDEKNDAALFELANINFKQNKLLPAEVNLKKAIALKPENVWYYRLLAEVYKKNGNMMALVSVFEELIKLLPDSEGLYFDRAQALFLAGKPDEALQAYRLVEEKFGPSAALSSAVRQIQAQKAASAPDYGVTQLLDDNTADLSSYLKLSSTLLEKKQPDEALNLLQKAKALNADNYETDLLLAEAYLQLKQSAQRFTHLEQAFNRAEMPIEQKTQLLGRLLTPGAGAAELDQIAGLIRAALKVTPDEPALLMLYGDACYRQGNLALAKEQYRQALKISKQMYPAWEKLLALETVSGAYEEAVKTGEKALDLYPNQAILYYYRAFSLHRNGQNAEAELDIRSALQLDGDDVKLKALIFALQAEVFIDQQKLKEADQAFDKSIALEPDNYLTLSNYAYYLALRNHNLTKAEALAAKAARAEPKNASIADTYAFVLFKLEKYEQAKTWIEKAIQYANEPNPVYLEHYGDILFMKGEKEQALLQWQKALQAGGDSSKLKRKINEKKYIK